MLTKKDLQKELEESESEEVTKFIRDQLIPMCEDAKDADQLYRDRDTAVLGFLKQLHIMKKISDNTQFIDIEFNLEVGWRENSKTDENWVAVCARLPQGQVSWTIEREEVPDWMVETDMEYDGHTVEDKLGRLEEYQQYV